MGTGRVPRQADAERLIASGKPGSLSLVGMTVITLLACTRLDNRARRIQERQTALGRCNLAGVRDKRRGDRRSAIGAGRTSRTM